MLLCFKLLLFSVHMHMWRKAIRDLEEISLKCIKSAESIVNMSYSQAEVYTSVNIRRVVTTCPYKILHEM